MHSARPLRLDLTYARSDLVGVVMLGLFVFCVAIVPLWRACNVTATHADSGMLEDAPKLTFAEAHADDVRRLLEHAFFL